MQIDYASLPAGFHFAPSGRCAFISYKEEGKVLVFDCEMSGVSYIDLLIFPTGVENWVFPVRDSVSESKQKQILDELRIWLDLKGLKSDLFYSKYGRIV